MTRLPLFADRADAGRWLARSLEEFRGEETVVVALPRGGVPVGYEVARALGAPLDVCIVRKIGAPIQPEVGIGAVAEDGVVYVDGRGMAAMGVSERELGELARRKRDEVAERIARLRRGAPAVDLAGKTVLVVDDGVATGGTARAALAAVRARGADRVILAVPVGATDTLTELASSCDRLICLRWEDAFSAVGAYYRDFEQVTETEVIGLLSRALAGRERRPPLVQALAGRDGEVEIPVDGGAVQGSLCVPPGARGLVVFAHGSGSSRHSKRNRHVAAALNRQRIGTLLFDLLTDGEARRDAATAELVFDIDFLATRLVAVTDWVRRQRSVTSLPVGYFGASTGAAVALTAATERPEVVHAVVSRGGRPDLASAALPDVAAPTLLIVGGDDSEVLALNRAAYARLRCPKELEVLPDASHLFEEPGALDQVAKSAGRFFSRHFTEAGLAEAG